MVYKGNSASVKAHSFSNSNRVIIHCSVQADGQAQTVQVKYGIFERSSYMELDGKIRGEHKLRGTAFNPLSNTSGSGTGTFYQDLWSEWNYH